MTKHLGIAVTARGGTPNPCAPLRRESLSRRTRCPRVGVVTAVAGLLVMLVSVAISVPVVASPVVLHGVHILKWGFSLPEATSSDGTHVWVANTTSNSISELSASMNEYTLTGSPFQASRLGQAGPSIAVVAFCGYAGMLAGPAVIGTLAGAVGLPAALSVDAGLATTIWLLCGVLTLRPTRVTSL
jgi:hypothetical protein